MAEAHIKNGDTCHDACDHYHHYKGKISIPWFHMAKQVKLKRKSGGSEVFFGDGSYLNEFNIVAKEIIAGKKESDCVPRQATIDVMEIMDECRSQMGLVYPFER